MTASQSPIDSVGSDPARPGSRLFREAALVATAFAIAVLLSLPSIAPSLAEINPYDEAKYIDSGRSLVGGALRDPAWGPLLSLVYAPIYLIVRDSPHWFVLSASVGRLLLLALLWFSAYRLAVAFRGFTSPRVVVGMLFVSIVPAALLANSSDALLAALGALALAELAGYGMGGPVRRLVLGSIWLGLASLTRLDGIVLFGIFAAAGLVLSRNRPPWKTALAAILLPFATLFAGYVLLRGGITGDFRTSIQERSYAAFEQGQWTVTGGDWGRAVGETRRLFGAPEENGHSILQAARRNPSAFVERMAANLRLAPQLAVEAYHKRQAPILAVLAAAGAFSLARKRAFVPLALLLAWPTYLTIYTLTFFRSGYLLSAYYPLFMLAAVGLSDIVEASLSTSRKILTLTILAGLILGSGLASKPAFAIGLAALLGSMVLYWLGTRPDRAMAPVGFLLVLAGAIVLRDGFAFSGLPRWGQSPQEKAVAFLAGRFPPATSIFARAPLVPLAARMTPVDVGGELLGSGEDLVRWMEDQNISAIYLDGSVRVGFPEEYARLQQEVGRSLDQAFVADPGSIQILVPSP